MSGEGEGGIRWALAGALVLALAHFFFRPYLVRAWWSPDLLAAAVLVAALHLRAGRAALVGFVLGLLEGAMALEGLGILAAGYAALAYAGARMWDLFYADARLFLPVYLLLGAWALLLVNAWTSMGGLTWSFSLLRAPVAALTTAVAAGAVEGLLVVGTR